MAAARPGDFDLPALVITAVMLGALGALGAAALMFRKREAVQS